MTLTAGLVVTMASIAGVEALLRWRAPVPDPYAGDKNPRTLNQYIASEHPRNHRIALIVDEPIPGVDPRSVFTTNSYGLRGPRLTMPKPADEFRVFLIGDSVFECLFLDDSQALSRVIEDALNAGEPEGSACRVYGAGRSHDKSDDHVALFTQRLVHLQPDLVVFCSAVNDLMSSLDGYDHLHFVESASRRVSAGKLFRMLLTQCQVARRVFYFASGTAPEPDGGHVLRSQHHAKVARRRASPMASREPRANIDAYRSNVRTIVGAAKAHGIDVLLMTQPSTWQQGTGDDEIAEAEWRLNRGGVTYRRDVMAREMDRLNDVLRQLAAEFHVPLVDTARVLPISRESLYDDVHLTIAGARQTGEAVARAIRDRRA